MNLEPVIQSEVSQKEENKYSILTHIYRICKNDIDEPICREGMETQIQRTDLWTQQGKQRVGVGESSIVIYMYIYTHTHTTTWKIDSWREGVI